jgi:hypothetical protein
MEGLVVLFGLGFALLVVAGPIVALVALARIGRLVRELEDARQRIAALERGRAPRPVAPTPPSPADAGEALSPEAPRPEPPPRPAPPARPVPPPRSPRPPSDFATNLGPRLLVGAGALAVIVFLGNFVRYAWENDWVGPTGRVLSGAAFSLGLLALGLRLMRRRYRPLGQGLAAAGLAGLYVSGFAAHAIYGLVPRLAAGGFMLAVTASAVALALRLPARLLAALAALGGYLVPVLLSTGGDRGESLLAYLLLLGAGAVWLDRRRPWRETLPIALAGSALLFAAWAAAHFQAGRFDFAAVALFALAALFALGPGPGRRSIPTLALVLGGLGSIGLAEAADRPMSLLVLLGGLAGLAVLARRRGASSEAISASLAAGAVLAWLARYFEPDRSREALALGLGAAGLYFLIATVRGFLGERLGPAGLTTHVASAALAWAVVYPVLDRVHPALLGPAAVALAALHLAVGLAARNRGGDVPRTRVTLGLAAAFLTIAIPAQLGLHGITLGWALEGALLAWLGARQGSSWTRAAGGLVLALAVLRLFARHWPLHAGPFDPVLNASFGTWLAVILALVAVRVLAGPPAWPLASPTGLATASLAPLALVLLFVLLTAETRAAFVETARAASAAGDAAIALAARRQGHLAVSVLWTLFATALLAGNLGARSRGLFFAAYALFAVTAGKVVLIDLSSLPTLYRMLSFLALGVLLLAGAWLNLRFRERLLAPTDAR